MLSRNAFLLRQLGDKLDLKRGEVSHLTMVPHVVKITEGGRLKKKTYSIVSSVFMYYVYITNCHVGPEGQCL
jgi:hypothetical protein